MTLKELKKWQKRYITPLVSGAKESYTDTASTAQEALATNDQQKKIMQFYDYAHSNKKNDLAKEIVKQTLAGSGIHLTKNIAQDVTDSDINELPYNLGQVREVLTRFPDKFYIFYKNSIGFRQFTFWDYDYIVLNIDRKINHRLNHKK